MAEFNLDAFLDKLNFSDPINGDELFKMLFQNVDASSISTSLKNTVIGPMVDKIKILYTKIGDKASDLSGNSKAIEGLADPSGILKISKDSQYTKSIKEKMISPVMEKLEDFYKKVGEKINSNQTKSAAAMADPSGILEARKEQKKKVKDMLEKNVSSLKIDEVKPLQEEKPEDSEKPKKRRSKKTVKEESEAETDKEDKLKEKAPKEAKEQQTFEDSGIKLSDETMEKFSQIAGTLSLSFEDLFKKGFAPREKEEEKIPKEVTEGGGFFSNLLKNLSLLLLGGGAIMTLVVAFWPEIKKWLEEKLGISFDFMDKFKGIFEGLAKWFTIGGVGSGGLFLRIQGKAFETIGEFFERGIGGVISSFFGKEAAKEGAEIGTRTAGKGLFKLLGKALGGISKVALKSIPVIGALFSFWFAYDSFQEGDTVGGFINIASGLASLLDFVLPGVGTGLSLAIDVLGVILDVQAGDGTGAERSAKKLDILKGWGLALWNEVKKLPLIEGLINLAEGFSKLFGGDFRGGLEQLNKVPILGVIPGTILAIMDAANATDSAGNPLSFTDKLKVFFKELKQRIGTSILGQFPAMFGIRSTVASLLGIESFEPDQEELSPVATAEQNAQDEKDAKIASDKGRLAIARENKDYAEYSEAAANRYRNIIEKAQEFLKTETDENKIKLYKQQISENTAYLEAEEAKKTKQVNDLFLPQTASSRILFDPASKTNYQLSPQDNVMAYKSGGPFDETIIEIKNAIGVMSQGFKDLQQTLNQQAAKNINVNNISQVSQNQKSKNMSGTRDPIFDARISHLRKYPYERGFA